MRWRINVLSLGDREGKNRFLANIRLERGLMVVCATLLTASSVCLSDNWLARFSDSAFSASFHW